jgi:hypothetical protein
MNEYRRYHFDRYRNGKLMAEGAIAHAFSEQEALAVAKGWYSFGDSFKLAKVTDHIKTPPSQSDTPE